MLLTKLLRRLLVYGGFIFLLSEFFSSFLSFDFIGSLYNAVFQPSKLKDTKARHLVKDLRGHYECVCVCVCVMYECYKFLSACDFEAGTLKYF